MDVVCFFEQIRTATIKNLQGPIARALAQNTQIIIVPEVSACLDSFPKCGITTSHAHMNGYGDPEDANYKLIGTTPQAS